MWIAFADHVEVRLAAGGELEPVRGLANKLPEHGARIAAALTLIEDITAGGIDSVQIEAGIRIAQHHAAEALRLWGANGVSAELHQAQRLLAWLLASWPHPVVSLPDIYRRGPNAIREKASAQKAVSILEDHGWLVSAPNCEIDGALGFPEPQKPTFALADETWRDEHTQLMARQPRAGQTLRVAS
jgi:hypothetical protein